MEATAPEVSIVIPVFNREELIVETLDSIRRQTFHAWEAVVVDDGSSDGTAAVIKRCAAEEPRIRLIVRDRAPKGANTCRNIGLAAARGKLVIFLDSDDLLAPHCLEQRTRVMRENAGVELAVFQGAVFKKTPGDTGQIWNLPAKEPDFHRFLRGDSVWQTSGPMWRKTALQTLGGFDEELVCWQDVDLHVRALGRGLAYVKRLELPHDYFYRRHFGPSISQARHRSREHVVGQLKFCAKLAVTPGQNGTAEEKAGVRYFFARLIFLAADNRHLDLAEEALELAQRHGIANRSAKLVWPAAFASYRLRARGLRGFAWLGRRMLAPYLPPPYTLFAETPRSER